MKLHWTQIRLLGRVGGEYPRVADTDRARAFYERFTGKERQSLSFLKSGYPHERPDDPNSWGPGSPSDVDWAGIKDMLAEESKAAAEWAEKMEAR